MRNNGHGTNSIWVDDTLPEFPTLTSSIETDICIIGAGIAGLTTAYLLTTAGRKVTVIEQGEILCGETGRTTAHLSNALDDRFVEINKVQGVEKAKLAAQSHADAIQLIEDIIKKEHIDCEFMRVDGYLYAAEDDNAETLRDECKAAQEAGVDVSFLENAPAHTLRQEACLCFPNQAQFNPRKYLIALTNIIAARGAKIYCHTHAEKIVDGAKVEIKLTNDVSIKANFVIQATNVPISTKMILHAEQEPSRTYAISATIPKGSLQRALYWDTAEPYHYVRLKNSDTTAPQDHEIAIIGGADHRTGIKPDTDPFANLEAWARKNIPQLGKVIDQWSGQVMEPTDYLAFLGENMGKKNNFIITGDSGHGMTHGTIGAMIISNLIMLGAAKYEAIYNPSRKAMSNIKEFVSHNMKAMTGYLDYFTGGDIKDIEKLPLNEGAVIRNGINKIAIYKDEAGKLHKFSAQCPHMKAILSWNAIEKSWDCPAHGSRFSALGEVLNAPANCGLTCLDNEK